MVTVALVVHAKAGFVVHVRLAAHWTRAAVQRAFAPPVLQGTVSMFVVFVVDFHAAFVRIRRFKCITVVFFNVRDALETKPVFARQHHGVTQHLVAKRTHVVRDFPLTRGRGVHREHLRAFH